MTDSGPRLRAAMPADFEFALDVEKAALGPYIERTFGWDEQAMRALHVRRFDPSLLRIVVDAGRDVGLVKVRAERTRAEAFVRSEWAHQVAGCRVDRRDER